MNTDKAYKKAAEYIAAATRLSAFTGAGISVESGVPPFRGQGGLWDVYDPRFLDIGYFKSRPEACWPLIKEIFYDTLGAARPNVAHQTLARWDATVVTQNIDNLHTLAGSRRTYEFHGAWRDLLCLDCGERFPATSVDLTRLPPRCACGGLLKPDFVFFGEQIPEPARSLSFETAENTDVMVVVGASGTVTPACLIPHIARQCGAVIIEVNPAHSAYAGRISHIHLPDTAVAAFTRLDSLVSSLAI